MGVIKQLKQFITGTSIFPVTKSNAVYDDTVGRLDQFMHKTVHINTDVEMSTSGNAYNVMNPVTGEQFMPVTNTSAVYDDKYGRLDTSFDLLITYGTTDLQDGVSKLPTGTIYVVYE